MILGMEKQGVGEEETDTGWMRAFEDETYLMRIRKIAELERRVWEVDSTRSTPVVPVIAVFVSILALISVAALGVMPEGSKEALIIPILVILVALVAIGAVVGVPVVMISQHKIGAESAEKLAAFRMIHDRCCTESV